MRGPMWNIALGIGFGAYGIVDRLSTGRWRADLRTRDGRVDVPDSERRPRILVHGVSVGEVNSVEPLLRELAATNQRPEVVISAATETGYARARKAYGERHTVVRFPLDFTWMVDRFLEAVDPDLVVLAELELWPGFLRACRRRNVPVCLVNGRMADASYRGYRRLGPVVRGMFGSLALVACQGETYRDRFVSLGTGLERTRVTGNLKWDAARAPQRPDAAREIGQSLGVDPEKPLVVAGSTGPGEEAHLLKARPAGVQLLLAPRNPERWDQVARLRPGMPRRSDPESGGEPDRNGEVFLLDSIGELASAYLLADVAFVGRSLIPMGGSNPLESVALGKPTVIGPHFENFAGVVADLREAGGLVVSSNPMKQVHRWLADPASAGAVARAGVEAVAGKEGAARLTADLLVAQLGTGNRS